MNAGGNIELGGPDDLPGSKSGFENVDDSIIKKPDGDESGDEEEQDEAESL
jgi:hypothetical protein